MKNRALLIGLFLTLPLFVSASEDAGLPGEFLNYGVGARPLGMGRAFTAVSDDVNSLYWNPAGLATYRSSQVLFQHSPLPLEGAHQYFAYSQPLYAMGSLGIGIVNLDSSDVPRTDTNNVEIGTFDHRETAYTAAYAHRFSDKIFAGSTVKLAENITDNRTERGFGLDAGGLYKWNERVSVGANFRNLLAPTYKFATEKEEFPRILRAGTAVNFLNKHLTTAFDLEKTVGTSQDLRWFLGAEGFVIENISLRAGINKTEIATGLGIQWRSIHFDYAATFQEIGFLNRFSVKFVFGGYEVDVKASPRVFSPVGLTNRVNFKVRTTHRDRIVKWIMTIRNSRNEVIQTFQGFNAPPDYLEWDGKTAQGQVAEAGRYTYRMMVTDNKDRVEKTPERSIKILAPTPFEIESK